MPHRAETIMVAIEKALSGKFLPEVIMISDVSPDEMVSDGAFALDSLVIAGDVLTEDSTGAILPITSVLEPSIFVSDITIFSQVYPGTFTVSRTTPTSIYDVKRARDYALTDNELPGITLNMGADEIVPVDSQNMSFINRLLNIEITIHVKAAGDIDTQLNKMRREVHQAIYVDRKLGEDFVIDTVANDDDAPEISGKLENPVARQKLNYVVHYRHSILDPGA